jgi:predicted membrane protein
MSLFMDERPEKKLGITSFAIHSTRGLIRDQKMRRNTMFILLLVALLLLFAGSTMLQSILRAHLVWFIVFWFFVGWLTVTAILLALFDLLIVRAQARRAKKILSGGVSASDTTPVRDNESSQP